MLQVAVIGYSGPIDRSPVLELTQICRQVGKALAERGDVLITGGRDGVMELVSESPLRTAEGCSVSCPQTTRETITIR